jgi:hypothetical protein
MHRVYEIFEVPRNGSPQRVTLVSGLEFAKMALQGLARRTKNECFAADARTRQVVMQMNVAPAKLQTTKRIFQITYNEELGLQRAKLLEARGYTVMTVVGNQAAQLLLSSIQDFDLFIVGHAAPEETRAKIVAESHLPRCQNSGLQSSQSTNCWSGLQRATERARDLAAHCLPAICEFRLWFVAEQDLDQRRMIRRPNAYTPARQTMSTTLLRTPHSNEGE